MNNINIPKFKKDYQVKIGLPVYNGGNLLKRAFESLLSQDYSDFELIISDNASNDETQDICNEYVKQDSRIIYTRTKENIGLGNNHTRAFELAENTKYFMWGANDNIWDKSFITKTMKALEDNPNATLCSPEINFIDTEANVIESFNSSLISESIDTTGMTIEEKYSDLMRRACWVISYGLYRYDALKKSMPFPNIHSGDLILLFRHLLTGDFIKIPERLFHYMYRERTQEDYIKDMSPNINVNNKEKNFTIATQQMIIDIFRLESPEKAIITQNSFLRSIKSNHYWARILEHENMNTTLEERLDILVRGTIYKNNVIKSLFSEQVNETQIAKKSIAEIAHNLKKIKNYIDKGDLDISLLSINGLISESEVTNDLLELKALVYHKMGKKDKVLEILKNIINNSTDSNGLINTIKFAIEYKYSNEIFDNIKSFYKSYEYSDEFLSEYVNLIFELNFIQNLLELYFYLSKDKSYIKALNNLKNKVLKLYLRNNDNSSLDKENVESKSDKDLDKIPFYINTIDITPEIDKETYLIFLDKNISENIDKNQINILNQVYDQIWVLSKEKYSVYLESGIDTNKIKQFPESYSKKTFDKVVRYISELKDKEVTRFNIDTRKISLKKMAKELFNQGEYKHAINKFSELLSLNLFDSEVLYHLGLCNFNLSKYDKALNYFSQCLEIGFYDKFLLESMGMCLEKLGDNDTAKVFYEKAQNI